MNVNSLTKQPNWAFQFNLGDANPVEHGGLFVYADKTGVYPPECELLISPEEEPARGAKAWEVRRFVCEPCTFINGILSDNRFHPDKPAWFADELDSIADTWGTSKEDLIAAFTGDDLTDKARAWESIGTYFGWDNLDSYPLFLSRGEVNRRYRSELRRKTN